MSKIHWRRAGALLFAAAVLAPTAAPAQGSHDTHTAAPRPSAWTDLPLLVPGPGDGRAAARLLAVNLDPDVAELVGPDGAASPLGADLAFKARDMKSGGYHLVTAGRQTPDGTVRASTVKYFSNPGPAPRPMLERRMPGLQVVPAPLPREHRHYREDETWRFLVRFDGRPLAGAAAVLETEHGSRQETTTDGDGIAAFTFPADIPGRRNADAGHARTPSAAFVVSARHQTDSQHHLGAYNDRYPWGAYRDKSLAGGVGFAFAGMLAALPLLRRRKRAAGLPTGQGGAAL